jgi:hypothetical protein
MIAKLQAIFAFVFPLGGRDQVLTIHKSGASRRRAAGQHPEDAIWTNFSCGWAHRRDRGGGEGGLGEAQFGAGLFITLSWRYYPFPSKKLQDRGQDILPDLPFVICEEPI